MTNLYHYSTGDLLESRNTYFYTGYHGKDFLTDYNKDRLCVLAAIESANQGDYDHFDGIAGINDDAIDTRELMTSMISLLRQPDKEFVHWFEIDRLTQRFEVTKRVYPRLKKNWRAADRNDYSDLSLYILLAELMVAAYNRKPALPQLNLILKLNDTLIAVRDQLTGQQLSVLAYSLKQELAFVAKLSNEVGVEHEYR